MAESSSELSIMQPVTLDSHPTPNGLYSKPVVMGTLYAHEMKTLDFNVGVKT